MRKPRFLTISISGLFHKMWRGHNREHILTSHSEKIAYLDALFNTYTVDLQANIQLHGYCLMDNHVHEVGRIMPDASGQLKPGVKTLGNWMRNAHSRFGQGYNRRHQRQGKVAYDRPKTTEIAHQWGLLQTLFYNDANPVRARLVTHPSHYPFSSHNFYARGKRHQYTQKLTPPAVYMALGKTAQQRRAKYRSLCDKYLRYCGLLNDRPAEHTNELPADDSYLADLYNITIREGP